LKRVASVASAAFPVKPQIRVECPDSKVARLALRDVVCSQREQTHQTGNCQPRRAAQVSIATRAVAR
jgi:hypothetical protein